MIFDNKVFLLFRKFLMILFFCFLFFIVSSNANAIDVKHEAIINYYYFENNTINMSNNDFDFYMNVSLVNRVEVVFELNYEEELICNHKNNIDLYMNENDVNSIVQAHRLELNEYFLSKHQNFIDNNFLYTESDDYEIVFSEYSPYIQLIFNDISKYQIYENRIKQLRYENEVSEINVAPEISYIDSAIRQSSNLAPLYYMDNIISDVGAIVWSYQ